MALIFNGQEPPTSVLQPESKVCWCRTSRTRLGSTGAIIMAQRRFHYEQAFEHYLRANRIPYVAVDEAKKSLIPPGHASPSIKSFDFVVYTPAQNYLIDVKGRMYGSGARRGGGFESWVTLGHDYGSRAARAGPASAPREP